MKQMTKEELIEYFIEQLGDNEILGKYITIEQIREKLNRLIKRVTYRDEPGNVAASWSDFFREVNFDTSKIFSNNVNEMIVHELLHVLSTDEIEVNDDSYYFFKKVGLQLRYARPGASRESYRAINEGMTDTIAERITKQHNSGYTEEKQIYGVLSNIIGEENMLRIYFSSGDEFSSPNVETFRRKQTNIFKDDLIGKYGFDFGIELNDGVRKVLSLADELNAMDSNRTIYGTHENGPRLKSKVKEELDDTLYAMAEQIIDREPDINKKIDLLNQFLDTSLRRKFISEKTDTFVRNIVDNNEIEYNDKIKLLEKLNIKLPNEVVHKILFEMEESSELSPEFKLNKYQEWFPYNARLENDYSTLYKLLVDVKVITDKKDVPKDKIFDAIMNQKGHVRTEAIMEEIDNTEYFNIGTNYINANGLIFNLEGKTIKRKRILFHPLEEDLIEESMDLSRLSGLVNEDKIPLLSSEIKNRFEDFKSILGEEFNNYREPIYVVGDMIQFCFTGSRNGKKDEKFYFKINNDGTLEKQDIGEVRRFRDDKTKEDIEKDFEELDISGLSVDDKIREYAKMFSGKKEWMNPDMIFNWYVESGRINPSLSFKRDVFKNAFLYSEWSEEEKFLPDSTESDNIEKLNDRLEFIKHIKFGNYYKVTSLTDQDIFYDEEGNEVFGKRMPLSRTEDFEIIEEFQDIISEDKYDVFLSQLNELGLSKKSIYRFRRCNIY